MHFEQWLLCAIVLVPLALVATNRLRSDLAAILMAVLLGILQLAGLSLIGPAHSPLDAVKAISGFSQPVVITLISLFIITRGLDKSGVTRWMAHQMIRLGGHKTGRLIALFAAVTAFLSLFMNNLAAGALVLPSAMEASRQTGIKPSKLLIPVAYGSLLGGSATYFTTANIIMSDLLRIAHPPQAPLKILDFTPTGGLIALAGILFLWVFGDRLLPDREPSPEQSAARRTGSELEDLYQIGERLWQVQVCPESSLLGLSLVESEIGKKWGITVAYVQRAQEAIVMPFSGYTFAPGDQLAVIGREEKVIGLKNLGLDVAPFGKYEHLSPRGISLAEVILAPHSSIEGKTLKEIGFRHRYDQTAIALKRLTRSYRTDIGDIPLGMGDSLLILGRNEQRGPLRKSPDMILIEPSPNDQPVQLRQALLVVSITMTAIAASIFGVPVYLSVLAGAVLTLLFNILKMEEAYQSVEWQAVFLIAGMYGVSLAMVQTGLAGLLGGGMLALVKTLGPLGIAGGGYLLSALLTQVMGGQVTALVTGPVTISAAISLGVNPQAVAIATAIGCSACFFTPMAHPVNVLMIAPANYKFSDFLRAGWALTLISFFVLLVGLVVFWHLGI